MTGESELLRRIVAEVDLGTERAERGRLAEHVIALHALVEDMDLRMPEQAAEDEDGWITSYRIPVGPWHRILGAVRGFYIKAGDREAANQVEKWRRELDRAQQQPQGEQA